MPLKGILYLFIFAIAVVIILRRPFMGIIVYIIMTFIRPEVLAYGALNPYKLHFWVYLIIIISSFIHRKIEIGFLINKSPILLFLIPVVVFQVLSSFSAIHFEFSYYYNKIMIQYVVFCFFMAKLPETDKDFYSVLYAIMIGSGFLAIWGFQQHFLGNVRLEEVGGGSTNSSNGIACLFVLVLPLWFNFITKPKVIIKLASIFFCIIYIADIVFTQSRAAFVAIIVMLPYMIVKYKFGMGKKLFILSIFILVFFIAAMHTTLGEESYLDRMNNMFEKGMEVDESASGRKELWSFAWRMFKDHPLLGVGQQHYQFEVLSYSNGKVTRRSDAHNTFLLILAEGGAFTFTFYLFAIIYYFIELRKLKKEYGKTFQYVYNMTVSLEASMVGFIICSMVHSYSLLDAFYWFLTIPVIMKNILAKIENNFNKDITMQAV